MTIYSVDAQEIAKLVTKSRKKQQTPPTTPTKPTAPPKPPGAPRKPKAPKPPATPIEPASTPKPRKRPALKKSVLPPPAPLKPDQKVTEAPPAPKPIIKKCKKTPEPSETEAPPAPPKKRKATKMDKEINEALESTYPNDIKLPEPPTTPKRVRLTLPQEPKSTRVQGIQVDADSKDQESKSTRVQGIQVAADSKESKSTGAQGTPEDKKAPQWFTDFVKEVKKVENKIDVQEGGEKVLAKEMNKEVKEVVKEAWQDPVVRKKVERGNVTTAMLYKMVFPQKVY